MKTDTTAFIQDLDGGTLESKLAQILSNVAAAVVDNERKGSVTLKFDISRIGQSFQVNVTHTLGFKQPTLRGESSEIESGVTPMHVGKGGSLTLFPANQGQLFGKDGHAAPLMPPQTTGEDD